MKNMRHDLLLVFVAFVCFIGCGVTAIPVTVVKPQAGYVVPSDPTLIDYSRMEKDWFGEIKVNWLSYLFLGLAIAAIVTMIYIYCRRWREYRSQKA
nr:putative integron gene cassette protein [uncultured bacterium]CAP48444.1 putative integron gene cassette protein [uncultured bacterium]